MTVVEYIRKKNAIILKHTGILLIPEDQIEECEANPLQDSDISMCPYCLAYQDISDNCPGCPMAKKGNCCDDDNESSTYMAVLHKIRHTSIVVHVEIMEELQPLINQFNQELKNEKEKK